MYDLAVAKPHLRADLVLEPANYRVYCEGYYTAISKALETLDAAARRWASVEHSKRIEARQRRKQAG